MRGLAMATTEASKPTMMTPTQTAARIHQWLLRPWRPRVAADRVSTSAIAMVEVLSNKWRVSTTSVSEATHKRWVSST